jgi:DNA-directed RNA polymerase specialized sigma24 family protein
MNAKQLDTLINELPPREADYLLCYFYKRKHIADIAYIFGVTSTEVHYGIRCGLDHLKEAANLAGIPCPEYNLSPKLENTIWDLLRLDDG